MCLNTRQRERVWKPLSFSLLPLLFLISTHSTPFKTDEYHDMSLLCGAKILFPELHNCSVRDDQKATPQQAMFELCEIISKLSVIAIQCMPAADQRIDLLHERHAASGLLVNSRTLRGEERCIKPPSFLFLFPRH
jgi:hypothetical protein